MRWEGMTAVIVASGPSLHKDDLARCYPQKGVRTIAVNESWRLAHWADALYAADYDWWANRFPPSWFQGERWSTSNQWPAGESARMGVRLIESRHGADVSDDPRFIYQGSNSGFQALALAHAWGARRIVLLGFDMQRTDGRGHWHGDHAEPLRNTTPDVLKHFSRNFDKVAPLYAARGVEVINASRSTALTCFVRASIEEALP